MSMDITQIKVKPIVWAKQLHLGGVSSYHGDPNGREPNFVNGYGSHDYEIGEFTDGRYKSEFWYRGKGFLLETGIQDLDRAKEICQQHKESRAKELMGLVELIPSESLDFATMYACIAEIRAKMKEVDEFEIRPDYWRAYCVNRLTAMQMRLQAIDPDHRES